MLGIGAKNAYLIRISSAVMALDSINIVPFAKLRFEHRAWYFVAVRTLSIIVNAVGNIMALAFFKTGLSGIFIAGIFASLTSLILLLPAIKEDIAARFDKNLFRKMFSFSWPFIPAGMASILVNVIDKPLLAHLLGLADVGIYQANFKIGVFMMLVVSMFDQAWRPFFIQRAKDKNHKELFSNILTYFTSFAGLIFLSLVFFMPVIIGTPVLGRHLINPSYWGGMNIIPLVLGGYLFYGFYINFMIAPVLTKKTSVLMYITLLGAAASVITNIVLVPNIGIIGAGWAILISYAVMAASLFIFLQRNYPIKYEYKKLILTGVLICAALCFNFRLGTDINISIIFAKAAALILYCLGEVLIIKYLPRP
jgi:O-antigen/teichoic acid export membrane protein